MEHYLTTSNINSTGIVDDSAGEKINLDPAVTGTIHIIHSAITAAAEDFTVVDTDEETATITGHGFVTGLLGQLTTTGTLPTGLSLATNYYIIVVDDDTVQFATSLANALAGTAVNLTGSGSGTHTFTPTAKSGSLQIQVSNVAEPESADWVDKGSASSLSGAAASVAIEYEEKDLAYRWMRANYTHTAGQYALEVIFNLKSDP